jgi:hypothetical protein
MEAFRTEIDPISDEKRDPVVVLLRTADFALGDRGLSTVASLSLSLSLLYFPNQRSMYDYRSSSCVQATAEAIRAVSSIYECRQNCGRRS